MDNISEDINMAKSLKSLLLSKLQKKAYQIIQTLYFILETDIKITLLKDFFNRDTQILICTNATDMGIDIPNIKCVI